MKNSSFRPLLNKLVNNKYVLYVVAFIALINILGYLMNHEFSAILFFILIAMVVFTHSKNMTVVLGSSIIATSILFFIKNMFRISEGMINKKDDIIDEGDNINDNNDEVKPKTKAKAKANAKAQIATIDEEDEPVAAKPSKKSTKTGYENIKLQPSLYNIPNKDQLTKQLGKADKMEAAYDNLEKVVGEQGIKSMSSNTKDLISQQKELLKGLKDITPVLNEAMGAVGKIDLGGLTKMFQNVNSIGLKGSEDYE